MFCVWHPRLALLRIALALVVGHHGLAAGPNPSLNAPSLSPGSLCGPASSSSGSFTEASGGTLGTGSVSPDFWPLPSHRLRSPGQGILIPDMYPTINEAFHAAKSPDVLTLRSGTHQIGEHAIKGGQFHNNEPCYFEEEVLINKKLLIQGDITGTDKPVLRGKLVLQQAVHCETWKPEEGGGAVELMTLSYRDLSGVHGFCLAIEGGCWLVQECEVRCTGEFSKAVWIYGGQYVFDDSYKGGGRIVDEYPGPDAVLKRSTIGGFCEGGAGGSCGWGMLTWQLAKVSVEDCLIEDAHFIGISACHASSVSVLGCTVEGCRVGAVLVNEEASMRVETCLLRDNACALVAGKEAMLASLHVVGNVIHGRVWHDSWGGQVVEANKEEPHPDGLPLFLGTWTDRGRIGDPDPSDVERYVRRVRANTWSRLPVRLSRPDAEQMGLDPPKKVVHTVVGRPGNLVLEDNQFASDASDAKKHDSESLQQDCKDLVGRGKEEDLVGIGLLLNVTSKGEVVVVALMVGHPAQMGGVEVGDLIMTVDSAPVWLPEDVVRRCAGPAGTTVTLGLLRGPYRGEIEITITRRFIAKIPMWGPNCAPNIWAHASFSKGLSHSVVTSEADDPALNLTPPPAPPHTDNGALAATGVARDGRRGEMGAGVGSETDRSGGGTGGQQIEPSAARVRQQGEVLGEEVRGEEVRGEEVTEVVDLEGISVGGILMQDLQRDPWADPPPDIDTRPVLPERWGSIESLSAGWGRSTSSSATAPLHVATTDTGNPSMAASGSEVMESGSGRRGAVMASIMYGSAEAWRHWPEADPAPPGPTTRSMSSEHSYSSPSGNGIWGASSVLSRGAVALGSSPPQPTAFPDASENALVQLDSLTRQRTDADKSMERQRKSLPE